MKNWVVLNGKKSTDVNGLLIQSLPAISKPLIRTEVEDIDGRDGDIVTYIGYSAYNKEMTIGLYGDYDIDDVIQYFDSSGIVIFSNEPDKYYKYQIYENIDFERLVRYRTATVVFHVQPFKYSAVEEQLTFQHMENLFDPQTANIKNWKFTTNADPIISGGKTIVFPCTPNTIYTISKVHTDSFKVGYVNTNPLVGIYVYGVENGTETSGRDVITITTGDSAEYLLISSPQFSDQAVLNTVKIQYGNKMILNSVSLINSGNTKSKPTITIYGSGTVNLYLNDQQIFTMALTDYITINVDEMQAYRGDAFMNRYVSGDYDDLMLKIGRNTLSWTGTVSKIVIDKCSRWI